MLKPVQKIDVYRMGIPEHHYDNGQAHCYLCRCNHHNEKHEELTLDSCIRVYSRGSETMHF